MWGSCVGTAVIGIIVLLSCSLIKATVVFDVSEEPGSRTGFAATKVVNKGANEVSVTLVIVGVDWVTPDLLLPGVVCLDVGKGEDFSEDVNVDLVKNWLVCSGFVAIIDEVWLSVMFWSFLSMSSVRKLWALITFICETNLDVYNDLSSVVIDGVTMEVGVAVNLLSASVIVDAEGTEKLVILLVCKVSITTSVAEGGTTDMGLNSVSRCENPANVLVSKVDWTERADVAKVIFGNENVESLAFSMVELNCCLDAGVVSLSFDAGVTEKAISLLRTAAEDWRAPNTVCVFKVDGRIWTSVVGSMPKTR